MWHTPVSTVSPRNSTPCASSSSLAAATDSTRSAMPAVFGVKGMPSASGYHSPSVTFGVSNSSGVTSLGGSPSTPP